MLVSVKTGPEGSGQELLLALSARDDRPRAEAALRMVTASDTQVLRLVATQQLQLTLETEGGSASPSGLPLISWPAR